MKLRTLIKRSLRFHWRSHLGVVIGAAIGSAALIGALIVGDSVKGSLRERALERLGSTVCALSAGDRTISESSARWIQPDPKSTVVPILSLPASASSPDGATRVNRVNLIGVNERFWRKAKSSPQFDTIAPGYVVLSRTLASSLGVQSTNAEIIFRTRSPSNLTLDSAISAREAGLIALRLKVQAVIADSQLGNFSLQQRATPAANAFVDLNLLGQKVGHDDRVNMILFGMVVGSLPAPDDFTARANRELRGVFTLSDAECEMFELPEGHGLELRTPRVFLDPPLVRSALAADTNAQPLLTYLANLITIGTNAAPYSMVTAAGAPWTPPGLRDDEIVLNQWLAEDLSAKPGDAVTLVYYDPESGARLTERTNTFRVHSIVPMQMPWADRTLMPQFPGIEKAETTAEWDTAFPLVHKIRPQDDDYWTEHRGTPKAFITLAAGQQMWANRFGNLTAIRFPVPKEITPALTPALSPEERENRSPSSEKTKVGDGSDDTRTTVNAPKLSPLPAGEGQGEGERAETNLSLLTSAATISAETFRAALEKKILASLKPEELGLRFEPVREQALKAAEQSQDFGGLFIGFSLFVIVAALLLMAMLFQFSLEQRTAEIGTLLALGFTPKQVRRLFLREGAALAFLGGILGTLGGIGYARAMLHGLTTLWSDAVGGSALKFFVTPTTLAIGLLASTVVAVFTLWLALRRQAKQPARVLLTGALECGDSSPPSPLGRPVAQAAPRSAARGSVTTSRDAKRLRQVAALQSRLPFAGALGLIAWALTTGNTANAGAFFGAGALMLIGGLAFVNSRLASLMKTCDSTLTPALSLRENHPPSPGKTITSNNATASPETKNVQVLSPLPAGEGQGEICPNPSSRIEPPNRSRRREEADSPDSQSAPPPHVGGYQAQVQGEGERRTISAPTISTLALRGLTRRRSRSVATVAMLASGTFLIVSIGVFRLDANRDATKRTSGTGGFALIGESTMPVVADLNTKAGRESFALNEADFTDVNFVQFRVRAGDEASCLNLNRAQKPRLLGVNPAALEGRFTFTKGAEWPDLISPRLQPGVHDGQQPENRLSVFSSTNKPHTGLKPGANEMENSALRVPHSALEIPAIGDAASIQWAMGKQVGDTLDYVDERGQPFKVRIVGAVANSILQGQLIIDEAEFVKRFPSESGYKFFLIDAPTNRVADVSAKLSRALQDAGLELTPASQRLAQFNAVQNTYLGTFQILGGLGLLLGSAGLGIVVLRNVLERRGELAVLLAVGWQRSAVNQLVLREHLTLLGLGLAIGLAAAAIAVLPSALMPGAQFPWLTLSLTLAAVLGNGLLWTWLAARLALRGDLLAALRND